MRGTQRATADSRVGTVSLTVCKPSSCMYRRLRDHSSLCSSIMAPTSRTMDASLGKMPTTFVHRLIWMLEFDRPQAIPIHGWAWEFMLQSQWATLPAQLRAAKPQFIYVDAYYTALIGRKAPDVASIIKSDYLSVIQANEPGQWYRRRT